MNRFYHPNPLNINQTIILNDFAARHALKVMRVKLNDSLILFNGDGSDYLGKITQIKKHELKITIQTNEKISHESPVQITLIQSLSSNEKMDWIIQKTTELGIFSIQPILSERSIIKLNQNRIEKKLSHWQQVAISSCEQCYRAKIPIIHKPQTFMHFLNQENKFSKNTLKLILSPNANKGTIELPSNPPEEILILVGPEGGFSDKEIQKASDVGFYPIKLGPRILRTETAPVSILSILQYKYGDFV